MKDDNPKILIIRLSSIGDILLATPFVRQTRQKFPHSQIDFVIKKEFVELLELNPNINNLITFDSKTGMAGLKKLKNSLIKNKYDYIFDLHNNFRSVFLRTGHVVAENFRIIKNKFRQFLYVKIKLNSYKNSIPISERYLYVGKKAGIKDDEKGLEIFWDDKLNESVVRLLSKVGISIGDSFYSVAPGAGFFTKKWPIDYYKILAQQIIKKYNTKIIVLGSANDNREGQELKKVTNVVDLTGKLSLLQSANIISKSAALVSNDTGLMHMATAVKTPVLAIFGSTVKEFGFFPYRSNSIVVENHNLNCRPCSHIGRHSCPKDHFKCMNDISPEMVIKNFKKLLIN
jgi:lipopolysaccharide heptosyltransferase II